MSEAMLGDRKLEVVARAAWEVDSAFAFAAGYPVVVGSWANQPSQVRESFRKLVESCLLSEPPDDRLWRARNDRRRQLFVGIVRCTAAALEMTIVYPGGVVRDWSQPQQKAVPVIQHAIGCRAEGCQGCVRANETQGFVSPTAVRQASSGVGKPVPAYDAIVAGRPLKPPGRR